MSADDKATSLFLAGVAGIAIVFLSVAGGLAGAGLGVLFFHNDLVGVLVGGGAGMAFVCSGLLRYVERAAQQLEREERERERERESVPKVSRFGAFK